MRIPFLWFRMIPLVISIRLITRIPLSSKICQEGPHASSWFDVDRKPINFKLFRRTFWFACNFCLQGFGPFPQLLDSCIHPETGIFIHVLFGIYLKSLKLNLSRHIDTRFLSVMWAIRFVNKEGIYPRIQTTLCDILEVRFNLLHTIAFHRELKLMFVQRNHLVYLFKAKVQYNMSVVFRIVDSYCIDGCYWCESVARETTCGS